MSPNYIGEFEQMVLLAILRLGEKAYALDTRRELKESAGRRVSRGALYTTLERLEKKGFLTWVLEAGGSGRGHLAKRRFEVTSQGLESLRDSRRTLITLWNGVEEVLEK